MSDRRLPVEICKREDGSLDINCLDTMTCLGNANGEGRLLWQMPIQEAVDLARWWRTESNDVKNGQVEVRNKRVGSVLASMFTATMMHVRGLDRFGNIRIAGYSLPRAVVEYLEHWTLHLDSRRASASQRLSQLGSRESGASVVTNPQ